MIDIIGAVFVFFNLFYVIALLKKDFSVIDIAWGLSFLLIYIVAGLSFNNKFQTREIVVAALVLIWSLRLSAYIFYRSIKMEKEDYRYAQWRKDWGSSANVMAYFRVYLLQAVLSLVMASPLILIQFYQSKLPFGTPLDYFGVLLWVIGFLFEAIGDYQKSSFKSDPKNFGRILTTGLWKYTRHPNYFGESLLWWGIFLIVINEVPIYSALWGPFILTFFLLKVSGVALLEKKYKNSSEYERYKRQTNAFIPWFKRGENE